MAAVIRETMTVTSLFSGVTVDEGGFGQTVGTGSAGKP